MSSSRATLLVRRASSSVLASLSNLLRTSTSSSISLEAMAGIWRAKQGRASALLQQEARVLARGGHAWPAGAGLSRFIPPAGVAQGSDCGPAIGANVHQMVECTLEWQRTRRAGLSKALHLPSWAHTVRRQPACCEAGLDGSWHNRLSARRQPAKPNKKHSIRAERQPRRGRARGNVARRRCRRPSAVQMPPAPQPCLGYLDRQPGGCRSGIAPGAALQLPQRACRRWTTTARRPARRRSMWTPWG